MKKGTKECPLGSGQWLLGKLREEDKTDLLLLLFNHSVEESSPAPQFKSINPSALSLLYGPTLISIHDYYKNHSFD